MKNNFTLHDIKWIKNVNNKDPNKDSAYLSHMHGEFLLEFPKKHKGNVLHSSVGEIIVLYQTIKGKRVFTHLVTPIDNKLIENHKKRLGYPYGRQVNILAMTDNSHAIPVKDTSWSSVNFQGIGHGNVCKIENIKSIRNITSCRSELWQLFQPYFLKQYSERTIIDQDTTCQTLLDNEGVEEGDQKLITHLKRERKSSRLVRQKKEQAKKAGAYYCNVCKFSFVEKYSIDYMECHHLYPISQIRQGETRRTKLSDLVLVCANCHRMLHKKIENGLFLSIKKLRERLRNCAPKEY